VAEIRAGGAAGTLAQCRWSKRVVGGKKETGGREKKNKKKVQPHAQEELRIYTGGGGAIDAESTNLHLVAEKGRSRGSAIRKGGGRELRKSGARGRDDFKIRGGEN